MSKNLTTLTKSVLVEMAEEQMIALTRENGKVKETREQIIALIQRAEEMEQLDDEIELDDLLDLGNNAVQNLLNEGVNTMSNSAVNYAYSNGADLLGEIGKNKTGIYCPVCKEKGIELSELTINVVNFCHEKFVGKAAVCFTHQSVYKKEAKQNEVYQKNFNAGNTCFNCGNTLSDEEVKYNKDHFKEYPEVLQENLYCRHCQPNKVASTKYTNVEQAKADEQHCYACSRKLSEGEKVMGYYHHNKYGEGLTDKCLCFGCAPKAVVALYKGIKATVKYQAPVDEPKVAETPVSYSVPSTPACECDFCGSTIASAKAKQLSAIASAMVPKFKGLNVCPSCLDAKGYLEQLNK